MFSRRNILITSLVASTLFASSTLADVAFSSPAAGAVISGSSIDVEFAEGGEDPPITDFTSYILQLCAGGNADGEYTPIVTFTTKGDFSALTYTAQLTDLTVGGDTENAYFLLITSTATTGVVKNFSSRFTLSGMTGQFSAAVKAGLADVSGTDGPTAINGVTNPATTAAAGTADGASLPVGDTAYQVPYTMQTGIVRYAPMPKKAPSKITVKGDARQFPTSSYVIWSRSGMPTPEPTQTYTEAYTWSVSSMEATIAPQSAPDDMQKFLNRWRD